MSIAAAPAYPLTIEQWYELYHDDEGGRSELVRGAAIVTPTEAFRNITAARRLERLFEGRLGPGWTPFRDASVELQADPTPTVRVPDLLLARADLDDTRWLFRASAREVVLVVEVLSPTSITRDWVAKRADYAAAGIPNYLIVDVRGDTPRVWLFDQLESGAATAYPRYADPTGDGTQVTIRIPGHAPITITATELT